MSDDSTTECLLFPEIFLKPVVALKITNYSG
jgi:hypothetical protein